MKNADSPPAQEGEDEDDDLRNAARASSASDEEFAPLPQNLRRTDTLRNPVVIPHF